MTLVGAACALRACGDACLEPGCECECHEVNAMTDPVAFLKARLDEDEAAADGAYYEGQRWLTEEEGVYRYPADEVVHYADRKVDARHMARWEPVRVLREVAASRTLLEEYHEAVEGVHADIGVADALERVILAKCAVYPEWNPLSTANWPKRK